MKKLLVILMTFMVSSFVHAQQNFEGMIVYKLHAAMSSKPDAEMKIFFAINKLKILFKEKEEYDDEEIIVLLDSSARYVVNRDHKTFNKKMLIISAPKKQIQKRSILGYSTTPIIPESNGLENLLGGYMKAADVVYHLADSLYYKIPAGFEGNPEFIAIHNNKIVLAAEIEMKSPYFDITDTSTTKADIITAEAIEIKPMKINDAEFLVPADYTDNTNKGYEPVADTAYTEAPSDTSYSEPAKVKKPVKKAVKRTKPKTTVKSEATKRKE